MKYVIIIGDGMADNPVESLGGKTPLERVEKPVIDGLSKNGELGSALTVPRGMPPGSDTAILSIFGYNPRTYFSGRSPLEAAGSGVALKDGDISYRCNMVALRDEDVPFEERVILSHNAGQIDGESALGLMAALKGDAAFSALCEKYGFEFHPSPSFRHIAVCSGGNIEGMETTPPHDILSSKIGGYLPRGCADAGAVLELMRAAHELLDAHPINERRREKGKLPANAIWLWAQGSAIVLPQFSQIHGKTGAVISAVPLVWGIARLAGLDVVKVEGVTGELDTNFEGKAEATLRALEEHDLAILHFEAPDECTHNGDLEGKLEAIRRLDSLLVGPVIEGLRARGEDFRVLILSDHKTLTSTRTHDGEPVPYILYDSREKTRSGRPYTEQNALQAGVFTEDGSKLMESLFKGQ